MLSRDLFRSAVASATAGDVVAFGHTHKPWHRVVPEDFADYLLSGGAPA